MAPDDWIAVQSLPLTSSGKLHRKAITSWLNIAGERKRSELIHPEAVVASEVIVQLKMVEESRVQEIWARVLSIPVERVGVNISFQRLGGDSITAM